MRGAAIAMPHRRSPGARVARCIRAIRRGYLLYDPRGRRGPPSLQGDLRLHADHPGLRNDALRDPPRLRREDRPLWADCDPEDSASGDWSVPDSLGDKCGPLRDDSARLRALRVDAPPWHPEDVYFDARSESYPDVPIPVAPPGGGECDIVKGLAVLLHAALNDTKWLCNKSAYRNSVDLECVDSLSRRVGAVIAQVMANARAHS